MTLPAFSMRELLEAGVHFGHQTHRWNPKMGPYIYGARNKIHIIDLSQTVPHLHRALQFIRDTVAGGGRVLFVGTKRQASVPIAEAAKRCGQFYVDHRWLGGMLTNWQTISKSIKRLKELDVQLEEGGSGLTKKETLQLTRQRAKLERALGGIRDMGGLPDVMFVIDTNREEIAVHEANNLKIPVVAVLDTNCNPDGIAFPIPGNDDATRAIKFFCDLVSATVLDGLQEEMTGQGIDVGASEKAPVEPAIEAAKDDKAEAPAKTADKADEAKGEKKAEAEKEAPAEAKDKADEKVAPKKEAPKKEAKAEKAPAEKEPAKKAPAKKAEAKKVEPKKAEPKKAAAKKTTKKDDDKK